MIWSDLSESDRTKHDPAEVFAAGERNHHISNTAYPIAHRIVWKPYRSDEHEKRKLQTAAIERIQDFALYSHIPFCETRCYFCEYTVVSRDELQRSSEYMELLSRELKMYTALLGGRRLHGFDIGGGTPSFVEGKLIARHVEEVMKRFDCQSGFEISIETTPRIAAADPDKMRLYHDCGIRRISMGIQVVQPDLLRALGRDSNGLEHHFRARDNIRRAGFEKFNVDLMYGFAGQSLLSWEETLRQAIRLNPDFITLYRMRYKLTRISSQAANVRLDDVRDQLSLAAEILTREGYLANPGKNTYSKISNHAGTSAYLTRRVILGMPYLGLGLGAQTMTNSTISYNDGSAGKKIHPYARSIQNGSLPVQDVYDLPLAQMTAKMAAVSLYFGEINTAAFLEKFGLTLEEAYPDETKFALAENLMHYTESGNGIEIGAQKNSLALTKKGASHFNGTIALFFAPSVKEYLIGKQDENSVSPGSTGESLRETEYECILR